MCTAENPVLMPVLVPMLVMLMLMHGLLQHVAIVGAEHGRLCL